MRLIEVLVAASAALPSPASGSDVASMSCVYDGMTLAERDALHGPELRDPGIGEAAHAAARVKVAELGRACVEKWRWDRQDIAAAAVYLSVRTGYETSRRQLTARGVRAAVIDSVIARLTPEQRARIRGGEMDDELGMAIARVAFEDATFRKAMEDDTKSPSAARLLGRAVGGKLFMNAASKGELSIDDLRRFAERAQPN